MHIAHNNLSPTLVTAGGVVTGEANIKKLFHDRPAPVVVELTPEQIEAKQAAIKMADEIAAKEAECLKTIHTRFCIIKGLPIDVAGDVSRYVPDEKKHPQYREYWYMWGTPSATFLMARDLKIVAGVPEMSITFNRDLVREGE